MRQKIPLMLGAIASITAVYLWSVFSTPPPFVEAGIITATAAAVEEATTTEAIHHDYTQKVRMYLESKKSPLAPETEFLLAQEHWKLLVAISAIESQFCRRKISYNCWGIGGDSAYRHYDSYQEAIKDANDLIVRWQKRGRWLTVDDMNCHYVQPCSENWVRVVNNTLKEIETL